MTTATTANQPLTARAFLFGDTDLGQAMQTSGVADTVRQQLRGFTQATRDEAVQELEKLSADLLDLDLTQVGLGAWTSYAALKEAGRRTTAVPGSEELVELLSHRVILDNRPSIELLVNGERVATVHFVLMLRITVEALTATVRAGKLVGLRVGRCDLDASVSVEGVTLASRQARVELPFSVRLGSGIALVR